MDRIEFLKEQIQKTEKILAESRENLADNPDQYSAKLLLLSTENHLSDLLRELDFAMLKKNISKGEAKS